MGFDQQTELLGEPREVDVVAIERELVKLWKDASGGNDDPSSAPVVRACALNFIVLTEHERELDEIAELVGDVTVEHPARIFLVAATRRKAAPVLDAWISARCSIPVPGGKQVCCEQINLIAHGTEANKIPSIITSLLVPDVPSVLLWKAGIDESDHILQSLVNVVDRTLVDTSEDPSPEPALHAWRRFLKSRDSHSTFGDLAWTHLTPWRTVIANEFQSKEMREALWSISEVAIHYSSTSEPRHSGLSQALLLASWFANKLGWLTIKPLQRDGRGEYSTKLRFGEQAINIRIAPVQARQEFPGGIESVLLTTGRNHRLAFSASEHRDCVNLTREVPGGNLNDMLTILTDKSEAMLVAQELEVMIRDRGYESVLHTLTELLRT